MKGGRYRYQYDVDSGVRAVGAILIVVLLVMIVIGYLFGRWLLG